MKQYRDKQGHFAVRPKLVKAVAKVLAVKPEQVVKVVPPPGVPVEAVRAEWKDDAPLDAVDLEAPPHDPIAETSAFRAIVVGVVVMLVLIGLGCSLWHAYGPK